MFCPRHWRVVRDMRAQPACNRPITGKAETCLGGFIMEISCATCRFWQGPGSANSPEYLEGRSDGDCRRRSPQGHGWNLAPADGWCGEHEVKEHCYEPSDDFYIVHVRCTNCGFLDTLKLPTGEPVTNYNVRVIDHESGDSPDRVCPVCECHTVTTHFRNKDWR